MVVAIRLAATMCFLLAITELSISYLLVFEVITSMADLEPITFALFALRPRLIKAIQAGKQRH